MSAIVFVCKRDSVEVLTDSLSIDVHSGRILGLETKQTQIGTSCVVATFGWALPCQMFTDLLLNQCDSFDAVDLYADALWSQVDKAMRRRCPNPTYRLDPYTYYSAIAGWSKTHVRPEVSMLDSLTGAPRRPIPAFALGGGAEAMTDTLAFIRRFVSRPDDFDAARDGVPLFESMRRSQLEIGGRLCHAVGGCIEHTTISAAGIKSEIIHAWPGDRAGDMLQVA